MRTAGVAPESFRTERLAAERLRPEHFAALLAMHRDPVVMASIGGIRGEAETRDYLDRNLEHWRRHGFGLWVLRDAGSEEFAGRAGLRRCEIEGATEVELAYAMAGGYHGRGLATEASRAILGIAFGALGLQSVVAFTAPGNRGSRRVMGKCSFVYERDVVHAGLEHVLYRLRRSAPAAIPGSAAPG